MAKKRCNYSALRALLHQEVKQGSHPVSRASMQALK